MDHHVLETARLTLRPLAVQDAEAYLAYLERNAAYLQPWEPARDRHFYTIDRQRADLEGMVTDMRHGSSARYIAFERDGTPIVASINLSNIRRGVIHGAIVSYSVGETIAGRGYATEMLHAVVNYAFDVLRLHRIEASYQPNNRASGRVLEKAGFVVEGYARDYLFLDGAWRDGVLVSRRNEAWSTP